MERLKELNSEGQDKFKGLLRRVKAGEAVPSQDATNILKDPQCCSDIGTKLNVPKPKFKDRSEAGKFLYNLLSGKSMEVTAGMWSWLALYFFDQLCPKNAGVRAYVGEKYSQRYEYYIYDDDYSVYYRHLLAGPYQIYRAHHDAPDKAKVALLNPVHQHGEVVEQLASRQWIVSNPNLMELATQLYVDPNKKGSYKVRAAGQDDVDGSSRRFATVLEQFDATYDLWQMSVPELLKLLPPEFKEFKPKTSPPAAAGAA